MAAVREADDDTKASDCIIYVMPQRIQKKMLQDIKSATKRTGLCLQDKFGDNVTHIVTQYTEREQVLRQLQRDGCALSNITDLDSINVVTLPWLSACLKAGTSVAVEEKHLLKNKLEPQATQEVTAQTGQSVKGRAQNQAVPLWACQRVTPLKHFNHIFTDALETLQEYAEFRDERSDYSRALAFRRASCLLKSLPFTVESLSQVEGLKDIGGHVLKVIQSILEDGYCEEVQSISNEWFRMMKEFTSVFGVGSATAKKWIEAGWKSMEDVRNSGTAFKDSRVNWGLAFHEDLTSAVSVREAEAFLGIVKTEAERILPGVLATMTGGFRRGKTHGHDVDILLTHPSEGQEQGLLSALLQVLERKGLVLMGRLEASTYTPDCLVSDSKLVAMRGQLDHFEKWLGICKFFSDAPDLPAANETDSLTRTSAVGRGEPRSSTTKSSERGTNYRTIDVSASIAKPGLSHADGSQSSPKAPATSHDPHSPKETTSDKTQKENPKQEPSDDQPGTAATAEKRQAREEIGGDEPAEDTVKLKHKAPPQQHDGASQLKRQKTSGPLSLGELRELATSAGKAWRARRVDLVVVPYSQYFYALVGWTGNKQFNRDLRTYAQRELGMKLTSHGLWDFTKQTAVPAKSEMEVFNNLKLEYKEPADRNC